jgi:two-component system, NtrC family, response regulator PilR
MSAHKSVLVVDDDEQLLRLIVRLLEAAGHRTRAATDLPIALALFESAVPKIDVALLDVNLAAASGGAAELLPLLYSRAPGLEVVLMSGDALPESLEKALSAKGGRFLRKPFAPKTLLRLLAEPLGDGSSGDGVTPPGPVGD